MLYREVYCHERSPASRCKPLPLESRGVCMRLNRQLVISSFSHQKEGLPPRITVISDTEALFSRIVKEMKREQVRAVDWSRRSLVRTGDDRVGAADPQRANMEPASPRSTTEDLQEDATEAEGKSPMATRVLGAVFSHVWRPIVYALQLHGLLVKSQDDHILSSESTGSFSSENSVFSANPGVWDHDDDGNASHSTPPNHHGCTAAPQTPHTAGDTKLHATEATPRTLCYTQPGDTDLADCGTSLWRAAVLDSQTAVTEGFNQASQELSAVSKAIKRWDTRAQEVLAHVHHVIHDTDDAAAEAAGAMMGRANYHHPVRSLTPPATRCTTPAASPPRTWSTYLLSHLSHDDRETSGLTATTRFPKVTSTATTEAASGRMLRPDANEHEVEEQAGPDLAGVLTAWSRARGWSAPGTGVGMSEAERDGAGAASCSVAAGPQGSEVLAEGLRTATRTFRHPHEVAQELAGRISGKSS